MDGPADKLSLDEARAEVHRLRRLRSVSAIAGSLIHDFNNTLGPIVGFVDVQRQRAASDADRKFLEQADRSLNDANRLLRALSSYLTQGPRSRQTLVVDDLLDDVSRLTSTSARHAGAELAIGGAPGLRVRVDRMAIMHAIMLLVVQVVESLGGGEKRIELTAGRGPSDRGAMIQFTIECPAEAGKDVTQPIEVREALLTLQLGGVEFRDEVDGATRRFTFDVPAAGAGDAS